MRARLAYGSSEAIGRIAEYLARRLPLQCWESLLSVIVPRVTGDHIDSILLEHPIGELASPGTPRLARMRNDLAIYSGRAIVVKEPIELSELNLSCGSEDECEAAFRDWLDGEEGFTKLDKTVEGVDGDALSEAYSELEAKQEKAFKTILHEYVHWRIFGGTSLATIYDSAAWRVRLFELILCENMHYLTDMPRLIDATSVIEIENNSQVYLQRLQSEVAENKIMRALLADIAYNHLMTDLYQAAASILVEPVTWALVEPGFLRTRNKMLRKYFAYDRSRKLASRILDVSLDYLRRGNTRKLLVDNAKAALDFPFPTKSIKALKGNNIYEDIYNLGEFILGRFESLLDGKPVKTAQSEEKKFGKALVYAVGAPSRRRNLDPEIRRTILRTGAKILKRESEIVRYGLRIVQASSPMPTYNRPAIFANTILSKADESHLLLKLRYDPLTYLTGSTDQRSPIGTIKTRTTGRTLNRIDDLVSDLPSTLATALALVGKITGINEQSSDYTVRKLIEEFPTIAYLSSRAERKRCMFALRRLGSFREELDLKYELAIDGDEASLKQFFQFWLMFLTEMGEPAIQMYEEHGL